MSDILPLTPNATFTPHDILVFHSPYHYIPTEWICILFVVLYSGTTILHLGQTIYFRMWWLLATVVLAGFGEIVGWSGRLWSSINPDAQNPFLMQITTTIIAPTPFLAAVFIIFARVSLKLGPQYSRLTPVWYSRIFLTCDIIALVIQAAGGGIASSADTDSGSTLGGNIMLGGIVFQLISLVVFFSLAAEYVTRYLKDAPFRKREAFSSSRETLTQRVALDSKMKLLLTGLFFIVLFVFIRSIYRTIELANGWNGRIISTQVFFNVLDGGMITLAMYTLNLCHPGWLLDWNKPEKVVYDERKESSPLPEPSYR